MSQFADLECCEDVLERIDAWIDGDLDVSEAAAVKSHIDQCETCKAERQLAELVVAELRSMPEFDVPDRVLRSVRNIAGSTLGERFRLFLEESRISLVPVAAAVAVVLIVLVVSPWGRLSEPQYSDQEIARAVAETRLALACIGSVAQRAELRVKEKVLQEGVAAQTVRGVRRSLRVIGEAAAVTADRAVTPRTQVKGS